MICIVLLRQRGLTGKANAVDGVRRVKVRERVGRAIPAPEANAEIQANLDVCDIFFFIQTRCNCIISSSPKLDFKLENGFVLWYYIIKTILH